MLYDLIDLTKLRRAILYALLLFVLFLLQDHILSHITILGVRAMLVPAAVVAVGLWDGGLWGGLFGLAAGYFCDMGYVEHTVFFTVLLPAFGFFAGALGQFLLHRGMVSYLVLAAVALAILTFCQMFRFLFFAGTDTGAVWRTGIIQLLWSLPWAVPVYYPCRSIAGSASS